ncbi:MAG: MmcQ/YjbR family DNA-binding protein [Saprospiraceae bacterium]|nr:MmcQ/YjbR family DNA-binding protein [Saprospiraceae bacterium]
MDLEQFRQLCLSFPYTDEYLPFDEHTLAFRVGGEGGKIFCLTPLDRADQPSANLKSDPEKAIELREEHAAIVPGYHMNKKHWNTVYLEEGLSNQLIRELVADYYQLVFDSLPLKLRKALASGE